MYTFTIDGCPFEIMVSDHAQLRLAQRKVRKQFVFDSIVSLDESLLDMNNGEEFCVMNDELNISFVAAVHFAKDMKGLPLIEIHIITVLDNANFHSKQTKRYRVGS